MIGTIVYQLTKNLSMDEIKKSGFDSYFVDHTTGIYPASSSGMPFNAAAMQVKGDIITDLHENLAADEKYLIGQHNRQTNHSILNLQKLRIINSTNLQSLVFGV